ncbi:outer membrane protein assembly factor BamD [Sinimarinibacterium sp. NLF-5-8]|uniref:outer membrane protein assembly factor BamD n=1 Tax=Sinimarinibacterium sp. NLF-5-8 TaxID=2698684 RepID=UPI00137BA967|nr:outer membrane protein assembly factor BamD [Sinimarinibacterium sp. NLF-5-8]QHS09960.1 outer membrane protein assembly factor BamD [Sinimarinibacterium sp. NLF-5-8]
MRYSLVAVATLAVALSACRSNPDQLPVDNPFKADQSASSMREQRLQAGQLYRLGRNALESSDFTAALQRYDQLILRYPFTDYAIQAQIERVYALYRNYQPDEAIAAADRFIRDYPRHDDVAYLQYIKGLVNAERNRGIADSMGIDTTRRDIGNLRRAFEDFSLLIQRYPQSIYVADARLRMIDMRNRIAAHELTVVEYYIRRGAYVAAAKRAEQIVQLYPGAPATLDALKLLQTSYSKLHMDDQAADARTLLRAYQTAQSNVTPDTGAATPPAPPLKLSTSLDDTAQH